MPTPTLKKGFEYILARVRFEYLKGPTENAVFEVTQQTSIGFTFTAVSSDGKVYESPYKSPFFVFYAPEPKLQAILYPGAVHEGWAVFEVASSDVQTLLTFGSQQDGTGGIWFKLY